MGGVEIRPRNKELWGSLGRVKFLGKVAGDFLTGAGRAPGDKSSAVNRRGSVVRSIPSALNSPSRLPSLVSSLTGRLDGVEVLALLAGGAAATSCLASACSVFTAGCSLVDWLSETLSSILSAPSPGPPVVFDPSVGSCTEKKRMQNSAVIAESLSPPGGQQETKHLKSRSKNSIVTFFAVLQRQSKINSISPPQSCVVPEEVSKSLLRSSLVLARGARGSSSLSSPSD